MKTFKQFIEFLTEDRLEFLKKKYNDISSKWDTYRTAIKPNDIVDYWAKVDPTPNHKYLDWIMRQYLEHDFRQEDFNRVQTALEAFDYHKARILQKDINQYHKLADLEDAIEAVKGTKSKREEIKAVKTDGADKIFDRGGVTVYRIKTEAAAKFYGAGTRWCTAADKDCQFKHYNKEGPLYVIFCKGFNGKLEKFQFHFESDQFMDAEDIEIDLNVIIQHNKVLQDIPEWQGKNIAVTNDKNVNIKSVFMSIIRNIENYENNDVEIEAIVDNVLSDKRVTEKQLEWIINDSRLSLDILLPTLQHRKCTKKLLQLAAEKPDLEEFVNEILDEHGK